MTGGNNYGDGIVTNSLHGDAFQMSDSATGGNDHVTGGNNSGTGFVDNFLFGDAVDMSGNAKGGNDVLTGGNSTGTGAVQNIMFGDASAMSDAGGNNILIAGTQSHLGSVLNEMWGDAQIMSASSRGGHDAFIFKDNSATGQTVGTHNYVEDFSQSQHDVIEFSGVAGVTSFANLSLDTTTTPGSTIIHAGADQVTLAGFTGTLTAHDVLIV